MDTGPKGKKATAACVHEDVRVTANDSLVTSARFRWDRVNLPYRIHTRNPLPFVTSLGIQLALARRFKLPSSDHFLFRRDSFMKALLALVVVCSFARAASAPLHGNLTSPASELTSVGAFTHLVNNTHAAATDSNNPRGTARVPDSPCRRRSRPARGGISRRPLSTGLLT